MEKEFLASSPQNSTWSSALSKTGRLFDLLKTSRVEENQETTGDHQSGIEFLAAATFKKMTGILIRVGIFSYPEGKESAVVEVRATKEHVATPMQEAIMSQVVRLFANS